VFIAGNKNVIFGRKLLIIALKSTEFHTKRKIISLFSDRRPNRAVYPYKLSFLSLFVTKFFKNLDLGGNFIADFSLKRCFLAKNRLVSREFGHIAKCDHLY